MIHHVHHVTTRDGHTVRIRPLRPTDTQYLVQLYDNLSDASRATRFYLADVGVARGTIWEQAAEMTALQPPDGFGLIAFADLPDAPRTPVGVVRYRLSPPDEAEASITIRDDFQSQGLGTQLIFLIAEYARAYGIRRLFGLTRSDSRFLQRLLRGFDLPFVIVPQGDFTYIGLPLEQLPLLQR
jgi:GNAT superfamily N-acetyltransferase